MGGGGTDTVLLKETDIGISGQFFQLRKIPTGVPH